jgi:hypothetical protein
MKTLEAYNKTYSSLHFEISALCDENKVSKGFVERTRPVGIE